MLAALALEACVGYPHWLFRYIAHPVTWIGGLISALERHWNRQNVPPRALWLLGVAALVTIAAVAGVTGVVITSAASLVPFGAAVLIVLATVGLAQRSLYVHVSDVLRALEADDLLQARILVGRIVGRDTAHLSSSEVAAAALESLAESFNDAVVAPAFWLSVAGLPGLFIYKAVNTADSMIGHKEERWRMFGWAAARCDDLLNLVPARCAGVLLASAAGGGFAVMFRDARKHASPNAGWTEAALAGGLAIRLGGPASYDGVSYVRPTFGEGSPASVANLRRGLHIYVRACALLWLVLALVGAAVEVF
ncbi:MAG: adenosylcobinamide-phosphate synthase CbiB [Steroidobacteraceae bacterium]